MTSLSNKYQNELSSKQDNNSNGNILKINNIDISKPHSMQLDSSLLKEIKQKNNKEAPNTNDNFRKNINLHSLDFYALGKVPPYKKISNFMAPNSGFRSTSNNMLKRNYFSINNRNFDDLKNIYPKKQATIYEQNINENNYLAPLSIFNTIQRYDLPNNVVNQETYNLAKEKLYAKDILSTIRKGKHLSRNDFFKQKQNLMGGANNDKDSNKPFSTPFNKSLNNGDNVKELKRYNSYVNIKEYNRDLKEKMMIDKEKNEKKLMHSSSTKAFVPKNPKDITKEELKNRNLLFDKNHSQIVRDRNWWKVNK
jgi:hypothetical protein